MSAEYKLEPAYIKHSDLGEWAKQFIPQEKKEVPNLEFEGIGFNDDSNLSLWRNAFVKLFQKQQSQSCINQKYKYPEMKMVIGQLQEDGSVIQVDELTDEDVVDLNKIIYEGLQNRSHQIKFSKD